jgi:hypothetical protein
MLGIGAMGAHHSPVRLSPEPADGKYPVHFLKPDNVHPFGRQYTAAELHGRHKGRRSHASRAM